MIPQFALNEALVSHLLVSVDPTTEHLEKLAKAYDGLGREANPAYLDQVVAMRKATTTENTTAFKPESLEETVTVTMWTSEDEGINTGLKLLGSTPATRLVHQYTRQGSYGHGGNNGFISELGRAHTDRASYNRLSVNLKVMGSAYSTGVIAAREKILNVGGSTDLVAIDRANAIANFSRMRNRALWYADPTAHRDGSNSPVWEGIFAAVTREATANSVIDMRGERLTLDTLRDVMVKKRRDYAAFNTLLMGPKALVDWEQDLDDKRRVHAGTVGSKDWRPGAATRSVIAAGREVRFATEMDFGHIPREAWKLYVPPSSVQGDVFTGSHPNRPTGSATVTVASAAAPSGVTSQFTAADDGDHVYIVTEIVDGVEGRAHTANGSTVNVAAGDRVTLTITPSSSSVESFNIYRTTTGGADPDYGAGGNSGLFWLKQVASSANGTAVTVYDLNDDIPGCEDAFAMMCDNPAWRAVFADNDGDWNLSTDALAKLPRMAPGLRDSIGFVHLGDSQVYDYELAKLLLLANNNMLYGVGAPIIRNNRIPLRFKNVGRLS